MPDPTTAEAATEPTEPTLGSQQCGRCRRVFEMEATSEPGTIAEMWLCASCRVALLGRPATVDHHHS